LAGKLVSAKSVMLSLGSNVGDRLAALRGGVAALVEAGVEVERCSSVYETEAVDGASGQRPFYNACLRASCRLAPLQLLAAAKGIERRFGRLDGPRHSPRPLDIDLLLYADEVVDGPQLAVPHPQLARRRFVLIPALELDPELELPDGTRLEQALAELAVLGEAVTWAHPPQALLDR